MEDGGFLHDRYLIWKHIHQDISGVMLLHFTHTASDVLQNERSIDALFWPSGCQARNVIYVYHKYLNNADAMVIDLEVKPEYISMDESDLGYYTTVREQSLRDVLREAEKSSVQSIEFYPHAKIRIDCHFTGDAEEDAIELADLDANGETY